MLVLNQSIAPVVAQAAVTHVNSCRINNPGVSTKVVSGVYQIHIDTFSPTTKFCFFVPSTSNGNYSSSDQVVTSVQNLDHAVAINYTQPALLPLNAADTPIATISSDKGLRTIQIFALPSKFPRFSIVGDTSEISKMNLLTTPLYQGAGFAVAIQNGQVAFWTSGAHIVETLRQLNDSPQNLASQNYSYAYLTTSGPTGSYSPGTWHFLNNAFQEVASLSSFQLGKSTLLPEGHDMTLSGASNPAVMSYVPRTVDSSWLSNPIPSNSILDCQISEVQNGFAIHSFSFWDWATSHQDQWKQLINSPSYPGFFPTVPVFGTTQTATDAFHCNSIQYLASKNQYAVSLRGLSSVVELSGDLSTVLNVITFPGAGQHFARSADGFNFTALGNYPNGSNSKFISWKIGDKGTQAQYLDLPFLSAYCANINVVNAVDLWEGGGCGTLVNKPSNLSLPSNVTIVGEYIKDFNTLPTITSALVVAGTGSYSYRSDFFTPTISIKP